MTSEGGPLDAVEKQTFETAMEKVSGTWYWGRGKSLLEDSQTSPARPYDRSGMKMKPLNSLEAVAWDKRRGFMVYLLEQRNSVK